jgi:hypothetical protein
MSYASTYEIVFPQTELSAYSVLISFHTHILRQIGQSRNIGNLEIQSVHCNKLQFAFLRNTRIVLCHARKLLLKAYEKE